MAVELRVKEIGEADFVVPRRIRQTQSVVHIAKETGCKIHGSQRSTVGSVPDFLRKCDDHHAQRRTQREAHRGAADLLEDGGANGKLGHLQGHKDDAFNVTNENLPGYIECTTRTAFDHITCGIARGCLHRDDFVGVGTHEGREELQGQSPTGNKAVSVNACEKTSKILVVYTRSGERVKVGVLEELDEVEDISFCQVVGNAWGNRL